MFIVALPNPAISTAEGTLVQSMIPFSSVEKVPMKDLEVS